MANNAQEVLSVLLAKAIHARLTPARLTNSINLNRPGFVGGSIS